MKKNVWVVGYPVSWAPCCKTWLKFEIAEVKVVIAKKILKKIRDFYLLGSYPLGWAPCCETCLEFVVEVLRCREKKNELKKNVWVVGYPVSWAPCCE